MADELPSLHIDTDWNKQAQAEKKRLAEQAAAAKATPPVAPPVPPASMSAAAPVRAAATTGGAAGQRRPGRREMPAPGFPSLVQSVMTQVLYYLGEIAAAGGQPMLDLDLAKHHLDTLTMLEDKTRNNLDDGEQKLLDAALYETRSRFITVSSQMLGP